MQEESENTVNVFNGFQSSFSDYIDKTKASIQITKDFADTVEGQLTNAFKNFFDFANKQFLDFKNLATSVAQAVINELINVFIVQKLVGFVKGKIEGIEAIMKTSGKAEQLTQSLPNLQPIQNTTVYGSKKALGGSVNAGKPYMVGESGRELFIPNQSGHIVSNQDLKQMGTAQAAPTVNFNINTVDAAGFDQLLASRKGLITSIINNAMNNQGKMGVV